MIIESKESKTNASLIDLLGGNAKTADSKKDGIFSKLLASLGAQTKTGDKAGTLSGDFKALIDPKNGVVRSLDSQKSVDKNAGLGQLQALLSGSEESEGNALISAELLRTLSDDQVRSLIHQAKEYLKKEIAAKNPAYEKAPETLPKSLIGLIQMAQKMGLEPESITLSSIITEPEPSLAPELLSKTLLEAKTLAKLPSVTTTEEPAPAEALTQLISQLKNKEKNGTKTPDSEMPPESGKTAESKPTDQPLKSLLQGIDKRDAAPTASAAEEKKADGAQNASSQTKNDGLIALLQGESRSSSGTADETKNLKTEGEASKALHAPKADSFEVKSKEAQQSMRHFAADLKEAVENYKPPFTRLTMKLNPEKLGEVEVTLVQRGNNVHVNIQSNNTTTVAFLAHNAGELKAQLAHQGITNATMNFMGGNDQQNPQEQQQHSQNRFRAYESFEELELNEEQLGALEIIIPHYA
jgi:flagellar hook-length control protein FliK